MIVVKDLKKNYNGLDVLKGIDLTINKGDVVCLVGPSGCGKTISPLAYAERNAASCAPSRCTAFTI